MADDVDRANDAMSLQIQAKLDEIRRKNTEGVGTDECVDCGVEIPAERKRILPNAVRCVPCQEAY